MSDPIVLRLDPERHKKRHMRRRAILDELGYVPRDDADGGVHRLDRIQLHITGFVSRADARSLEFRLSRLDGVEDVRVSYSSERAVVSVLDNRVDAALLRHVIRSAGFESYVEAEEQVTPEEERDARHQMRVKTAFWTVIPAVIVVASALMIRHTDWIPARWLNLVNDGQLYLVALLLWQGRSLFVDAARHVGWRTAAREVPIGLAASVALCASVWQFFASAEPFFDWVAAIVAGYHATALVESWLHRRAERHFRRLIALRPSEATVRRVSGDYRIRIRDLMPTDVVVVNAGEAIPVDGVLLDSQPSMVDQSALMGAGAIVERCRDSGVFAGTTNLTTALRVQPERMGEDTVLGHVLGVVESARQTRAPVQRRGDRVAAFVAPWTLLLAVVTFVGWRTFGEGTDIWGALAPALSVLVMTCPWALGWASAVPVTVGMTHAASQGVLLQDAEALESIRGLDVMLFERSGTLTEGRPGVARMDLVGDVSLVDALSLLLAVERRSRHVVAQAFEEYGSRHLSPDAVLDVPEAQSFRQIPGQGVIAQVRGQEVLVGMKSLLAQKEIAVPSMDESLEEARHLYLAVDGQLWARALVCDPFRPDAVETVDRMNQSGVRTVLITASPTEEAVLAAESVGISPENVRAGMDTDAHGQVARAMRAAGFQVGVVGNVESDQRSLQAADVSFGLVTEGTLGATPCAVSLLRPGAGGVMAAFSIARQAFRVIRQNIIVSVLVMLAGVPAAFGQLPLHAAVLGMFLAVLLVGLNGLRVLPNPTVRVGEPTSSGPIMRTNGRE